MTVRTALTPVPGGTDVAIVCENVPSRHRESDHQAGIASTLANLASHERCVRADPHATHIIRIIYIMENNVD